MRSIEKYEKEGSRVLVRVDYNVDLDQLEKRGDHFKISASRATLEHVFRMKSKVALLTHLGSPENRDPAFSTERLIPALQALLERKVIHVPECTGEGVEQALQALGDNEVLLLENVRYSPLEEANDSEFARALAGPFEVYVNEAFGVSHRAHASLHAVTKLLPSYAGFRLLEEISNLDKVRLEPEHPAVAIIGGAKISTKLPLIQALELNYDAILVGGKIANEALDEKVAFSEKVRLPIDFDSPERWDIGPKTVEEYRRVLSSAKTIIWNGPLGMFEDPLHERGTMTVLEAVLASYAFSVMGGGESLDILERGGAREKINFVSTGGGAMLEYLSGKILPALAALEQSRPA